MATRPPNPGTLADVNERLPEDRPPTPTMTPPAAPQSWGEWATEGWDSGTFSAGRRMMRSDRSDFEEIMLRDGYAPLLEALELDMTQNPAAFSDELVKGEPMRRQSALAQGGYFERMVNRSTQERLIAERIRAKRLTDPKFMPGVPDTVAGLRAYFLEAEKKKRAAARGTLEGAKPGLGSILSEFGGGVVEAFHDPLNIVTLPIGGGGKTVVQVASREFLINGMLELVQQPIVAGNREIIGEELTFGEAAANVGIAAAGGSILETGLHLGGRAAAPLAGKALDRVKQAAAVLELKGIKLPPVTDTDFFEALDNRQLTALHRELAGDSLTPDEAAAINVLERSADVADTSPFEAGSAGAAAHEQGLAEAIEALARENRQAAAPKPAPAAGAAPTVASPERPPGATSTAARRPPNDAIAAFKAKTRRAESSGDDRADNARSSAQGRYQFTDATWADYHRRIYGGDGLADKFNPEKQERLMDALTRDNADRLVKNGFEVSEGNLYLMHFLGGGDGPKVLRAADGTPIERLLSDAVLAANPFLKGKSASEVVAWAHGKMGGEGPAPRDMLASSRFDIDPAIARLRAEAADLDTAVVGFTPLPGGGSVPLYSRRIPASEALVDAARFQFKSGGDGEGVIDTLRGVGRWDPMSAGRLTFWQDNEGRYFVADGHQRSGLARRIQAQTGEQIMLDGTVLREADGVTPEMARSLAALVNIRNGSTSRVDAAKALRDLGFDVDLNLPPKSAFVRDAQGLARLSDDAFGAVINERVAPEIAATIGRLLPDQPELHGGMLDILARTDPANVGQAESIVRQAMAAGIHSEEQIDLFGTSTSVRPLFLERAKILEKSLGELRKMRVVHSTAAKNKGELEAKGSRIDREASEKEAQANAETAEIVGRLYTRAGPISDALGAAAARLAAGGKLGDVADQFIAAIRGLDLEAVQRGSGGAGGDVDGPDGSGRFGDAAEAGAAIPDEQPSLIELERATELFSDPDGPGVKAQADSLEHDLRFELDQQAELEGAPRLPNGDPATREQAIEDLASKGRFFTDQSVNHSTLPDQVNGGFTALIDDRAKKRDTLTKQFDTIEEARTWLVDQAFPARVNEAPSLDLGEAAWTRAAADTFLSDHAEQLKNVGLSATIVGGVATKVGPRKDLDLLVEGSGSFEEVLAKLDAFARSIGRVSDPIESPAGGWMVQVELADGRAVDLIINDEPGALDLGEAVDPAAAERMRQELALRAAAPLRPEGIDPIFSEAESFGFRLDEEGGTIDGPSLLDELDKDEAATKAMRDCL